MIANDRLRIEKTDFLLEQVRLCIAANDWHTAENMARKISTRWFDSKDDEETPKSDDAPKFTKVELKLRSLALVLKTSFLDTYVRYYDLMIRLTLHQNDYLATTKHYLSVYHTSTIQEDANRAKGVLQNVLMFVVLAQYNNEQSDLLARVVREDAVKNDEMGWVGNFVKPFTDGELMRYLSPGMKRSS
jgi:26S proteasome regulatory subunit N5